jgi:hypothetical protein
MSDNDKLNELISLKSRAENDIQMVKKMLKGDPENKGFLNCLNQAIDTFRACVLFIRIIQEGEDDVCWGLSCTYYDNNDHFIKNGLINKRCYGCCQADANSIQHKETP